MVGKPTTEQGSSAGAGVNPAAANPESPEPAGAAPLAVERRRFGVATKLLLAFGAIASLTILATIVAWVQFDDARENLVLIAEDSLPNISASFRLAEQTAFLSGAITRLVDAQDDTALINESLKLETRLASPEALSEAHHDHADDPTVLIAEIESIGQSLRSYIDRLQVDVGLRLSATAKREALILELNKDQDQFAAAVDPMIAGARNAMIVSTKHSVANGTARIGSLIDDSFEALRGVLELEANVNLLTSIMYQVAATDDLALVNDRRMCTCSISSRMRSI